MSSPTIGIQPKNSLTTRLARLGSITIIGISESLSVSNLMANQFALPFDVSLSYSRVIGGRNTERIEMAFADVQFYF